jgi:hypothetical protein
VLASGEQVVASETENQDLFWAIRGAGQVRFAMDWKERRADKRQNFGVAVAFTFQGHPQTDPVFAGPLIFLPDKL